MCPTSRWGRSAKYSVDGDTPCKVMVPRSLVILAAVWTNNASMSSSCCSVTSLIVTPLSRRLAPAGPLSPDPIVTVDDGRQSFPNAQALDRAERPSKGNDPLVPAFALTTWAYQHPGLAHRHPGHRHTGNLLPPPEEAAIRTCGGDFGGAAAGSAGRHRLAAAPGSQGQVPGRAGWRSPGHHGAVVPPAVRLDLFRDDPGQPRQLQHSLLTRTDSLYFTVTTFSTVGFGDITATSQAARLVVTVQMILDLLVLGLGIRVFIGAVQLAREEHPDPAGPAAPPEQPRQRS